MLVLIDFGLVDKAAPALLKTIEEPPDTTVIILIAETVPSSFVTIASRCVQVQFKPLDGEAIIEVLMGEGVDVATATSVAEAVGGRLDRARLLARDAGFAERLQRWRAVPSRLDGSGARVAVLVDELLASVAEPLEVVRARQAEELAFLQEEAERRGEKTVAGRSVIEVQRMVQDPLSEKILGKEFHRVTRLSSTLKTAKSPSGPWSTSSRRRSNWPGPAAAIPNRLTLTGNARQWRLFVFAVVAIVMAILLGACGASVGVSVTSTNPGAAR